MNAYTKFGTEERDFLGKQGFENFVSSMEFSCCGADYSAPNNMFCRIGLAILGADKQIGVSIEADQRLWQRFFGLPEVEPRVILTLCRASSLAERKRMIAELPKLAERHEAAWEQRESARRLIEAAEADILL